MVNDEKSGLQGGFTVGTFPLYPEQVERLVDSHRRLHEHPTCLAIWYDMDDSKDIKLLEAVSNFPEYEEPYELFTTAFSSTSEFLIAAEGKLILTLASPDELRLAIKEQYPLVKQVQEAFARNQAKVLFADNSVKDIIKTLTNEG